MKEQDLLNMGFVKRLINGRYNYSKFSLEVWYEPDKPEEGYFILQSGKPMLYNITFEQLREEVRKVTPKRSPISEDELLEMGFSKRKVSDLYYYEKDNLSLIYNPNNPEYGFYWLGGGGRHRENLTLEQVELLYNYIHEGKKLKVK